VRRALLSLFLAPATIKKRKHLNQAKPIIHPIQSHPSTQREKQGKKPLSRERKLLFAYFVAVLVTWMSFASDRRELRGGVLSMLDTHIMICSLIFRLVLILMFRLAFTIVLLLALFHMLYLSSLMDLIITHMVLAHERTTLRLDGLVTIHVLIVVTVSHVGRVFPLEGPSPTLSRDTWTVHAFPVMVHIPHRTTLGRNWPTAFRARPGPVMRLAHGKVRHVGVVTTLGLRVRPHSGAPDVGAPAAEVVFSRQDKHPRWMADPPGKGRQAEAHRKRQSMGRRRSGSSDGIHR
jgi:hypothetical protein